MRLSESRKTSSKIRASVALSSEVFGENKSGEATITWFASATNCLEVLGEGVLVNPSSPESSVSVDPVQWIWARTC